eukprot:CAMPEP_0201569324 /NCGR_PEP_ID=MMETSP0190_2-20130828/10957_1 /ASSEMBLY_ACC=CAM_ASM_000263 /TAXON_ID=37353 /ORGANISM="Rosalina sp." /LENGTH=69 /DNA_ID=CAMNT_0047991525 /DNA_START=331 /DNA_END=540 /DNA_ORIENTATION=+
MISMMNGNNNGGVPYGMGYTNTPNMPMGQPGFGAPQQPQQPQYPQGPAQYPQQAYPQYPPQGYPNPMWI